MKKKIFILLIMIIAVAFIFAGCEGKSSSNDNQEINSEEVSEENVNEANSEIIGTWYMNRNIRIDDSKYSLRNILGDSYGTDTLVLEKDGTFSLSAGMIYDLTGNYKFENEELSFYNIKDIEISNEDMLKDVEENLKLQYMEYNGKKFFKLYLYEIDDFEGYIFYEKDPEEMAGSYADDPVPEVQFKNLNSSLENKVSSNNTSSNNDTVNIDSKKQGYVGEYKNNKGDKLEIIAKSDGELYLKNGEKTCEINYSDVVSSVTDLSNIIDDATAAYIYPKGVGFSLSESQEDYEENETDSSKYRIFIKRSGKAEISDVYYK